MSADALAAPDTQGGDAGSEARVWVGAYGKAAER